MGGLDLGRRSLRGVLTPLPYPYPMLRPPLGYTTLGDFCGILTLNIVLVRCALGEEVSTGVVNKIKRLQALSKRKNLVEQLGFLWKYVILLFFFTSVLCFAQPGNAY